MCTQIISGDGWSSNRGRAQMELPVKHSRCTSDSRAAIFLFGIRVNTIKYAYLCAAVCVPWPTVSACQATEFHRWPSFFCSAVFLERVQMKRSAKVNTLQDNRLRSPQILFPLSESNTLKRCEVYKTNPLQGPQQEGAFLCGLEDATCLDPAGTSVFTTS